MASEPSFDDLTRIHRERRTEKFVVQAVLEEPADKIYSLKVRDRILRYHRWTHDQANILSELPFSWKFNLPDSKLTDEEELQFRAIKVGLIHKAILDKDNWAEFLNEYDKHPDEIERIYLQIMFDSMNTKFFTEKLKDFMASDAGFLYGYFWFFVMHKLPHEIGEMPDSSVNAANVWLSKWANRVIFK
jgi:hypothetical protein